MALGIDSVTRRYSEFVVGRPIVEDLGWTTAIELPVLPRYPLLESALEDDVSSSTKPRVNGNLRPQSNCQFRADTGCGTCTPTAGVSSARPWQLEADGVVATWRAPRCHSAREIYVPTGTFKSVRVLGRPGTAPASMPHSCAPSLSAPG